MKVLLVSRHIGPHVGGAETAVGQFLDLAGQRTDLAVHGVVLEPPEGQIVPGARVTLSYVSAPLLFKLLWVFRKGQNAIAGAMLLATTSLLLAFRAISDASKQKYDVIYAVGGPIALVTGIVVKLFTGLPLVMHFHCLRRYSDSSVLLKRIVARLYNSADAVIGNCKLFCTDAIAIGVAATKCHYVWNWVPANRFKEFPGRGELRKRFKLAPKDVAFCFVGRLETQKHADRVLAALEQFNPEDTVVYFAADGEYSDRLRDLAQKKPWIRPLGYLKPEQLAELYNACDCMLWGSVDVDYPGLVVMEAMMCGLPVITSSTSMNPLCNDERVEAESFGAPRFVRLFEATPEGIACGMKTVIDGREEFTHMRPEVADFARRTFGITNADRLVGILEACSKKC